MKSREEEGKGKWREKGEVVGKRKGKVEVSLSNRILFPTRKSNKKLSRPKVKSVENTIFE